MQPSNTPVNLWHVGGGSLWRASTPVPQLRFLYAFFLHFFFKLFARRVRLCLCGTGAQ